MKPVSMTAAMSRVSLAGPSSERVRTASWAAFTAPIPRNPAVRVKTAHRRLTESGRAAAGRAGSPRSIRPRRTARRARPLLGARGTRWPTGRSYGSRSCACGFVRLARNRSWLEFDSGICALRPLTARRGRDPPQGTADAVGVDDPRPHRSHDSARGRFFSARIGKWSHGPVRTLLAPPEGRTTGLRRGLSAYI